MRDRRHRHAGRPTALPSEKSTARPNSSPALDFSTCYQPRPPLAASQSSGHRFSFLTPHSLLITHHFFSLAYPDRSPFAPSPFPLFPNSSLHFLCRITFSGLTSPQVRLVPCSNSVFNSAAV